MTGAATREDTAGRVLLKSNILEQRPVLSRIPQRMGWNCVVKVAQMSPEGFMKSELKVVYCGISSSSSTVGRARKPKSGWCRRMSKHCFVAHTCSPANPVD